MSGTRLAVKTFKPYTKAGSKTQAIQAQKAFLHTVFPELDPQYRCVIKPAKQITLHSSVCHTTGHFRWAYVPSGNRVVKKIVFVPDNEPEVKFQVIENFSK